MNSLWKWYLKYPIEAFGFFLFLMGLWWYARWMVWLAIAVILIFRTWRWIARKMSYCSPYDKHDGDLCDDPRWPKKRLSRWFSGVLSEMEAA